MSKIYTAQDMRDAANSREAWGYKDEVNNMLRQSADAMEREVSREKTYEYRLQYRGFKNGCWHNYNERFGTRASCLYALRRLLKDDDEADSRGWPKWRAVRREVGEWEEVK